MAFDQFSEGFIYHTQLYLKMSGLPEQLNNSVLISCVGDLLLFLKFMRTQFNSSEWSLHCAWWNLEDSDFQCSFRSISDEYIVSTAAFCKILKVLGLGSGNINFSVWFSLSLCPLLPPILLCLVFFFFHFILFLFSIPPCIVYVRGSSTKEVSHSSHS
jgi:hypothetical protein